MGFETSFDEPLQFFGFAAVLRFQFEYHQLAGALDFVEARYVFLHHELPLAIEYVGRESGERRDDESQRGDENQIVPDAAYAPLVATVPPV